MGWQGPGEGCPLLSVAPATRGMVGPEPTKARKWRQLCGTFSPGPAARPVLPLGDGDCQPTLCSPHCSDPVWGPCWGSGPSQPRNFKAGVGEVSVAPLRTGQRAACVQRPSWAEGPAAWSPHQTPRGHNAEPIFQDRAVSYSPGSGRRAAVLGPADRQAAAFHRAQPQPYLGPGSWFRLPKCLAAKPTLTPLSCPESPSLPRRRVTAAVCAPSCPFLQAAFSASSWLLSPQGPLAGSTRPDLAGVLTLPAACGRLLCRGPAGPPVPGPPGDADTQERAGLHLAPPGADGKALGCRTP